MPSHVYPKIAVANWKMYKTVEEARDFLETLLPLLREIDKKDLPPALVYIAAPFTAIKASVEKAQGSSLVIGAQNMHSAVEGAFTGEIAASMLIEAGARFVLLGHSERRHLFHERDEEIRAKFLRALESNLQPILCVGETLAQREAEETEEVLAAQLSSCLEGMNPEQLSSLIVAYEPVWAIGTGLTATPEIAQKAHAFCREYLAQQWGWELAQKTPLLYGGSVRPQNSGELLAEEDIDGLLIGGASLLAPQFAAIIETLRRTSPRPSKPSPSEKLEGESDEQ